SKRIPQCNVRNKFFISTTIRNIDSSTFIGTNVKLKEKIVPINVPLEISIVVHLSELSSPSILRFIINSILLLLTILSSYLFFRVFSSSEALLDFFGGLPLLGFSDTVSSTVSEDFFGGLP